MSADLFPETLLVDVADQHTFTTSLLIAKHFHKRHDNVVRIIRAIVERTFDHFNLLNFEAVEYLDRKGERRPAYHLTRDGFTFVVQGFTGAEADDWKWKFIAAFNAMEAQLHAHIEREAAALRQIRALTVEVAELRRAGLTHAAIAETLGCTLGASHYHTGSARRLGLLPQLNG